MHDTRTQQFHPLRHTRRRAWLPVCSAIAGIAGLVVGGVSLTMLLMYQSSATAKLDAATSQVHHMGQELATVKTQGASGYTDLSGKVNVIDNALAVLAPYGTVCSQDLTGANGPAQFYFPCSQQKP